MTPPRRQLSNRTASRYIIPAVCVVTLFLVGCKPDNPVTPPLETPAEAQATNTPTTPTDTPTTAPSATPEPTSTPAVSIYGSWVPAPETAAVLVSEPVAGKMCPSDPAKWRWMPEIIIRETADPAVADVAGLHEHIASEGLPYDAVAMRIVDTKSMPEINETLKVTMILQPDGTLYYQEDLSAGGSLYCSASVMYIPVGD